MKTVMMDPAARLKGFVALFKTSRAHTGNGILQTAQPVAQENSSEFERKAFTGNFFAGPHCFFNPQLFR